MNIDVTRGQVKNWAISGQWTMDNGQWMMANGQFIYIYDPDLLYIDPIQILTS